MVTRLSVSIGGAIYLGVGILGYFQTGDTVCDSIFSNLPRGDALVLMGRIGLVSSLLLSYPLLIMPCRSAIFDLCRVDELEKRDALHARVTLGIVTTSLAFALVAPSLALVWSLVGSTVTIWIAFTLPGLFYVQARKDIWGLRKCAAWAVVWFSILVSLVCSVVAVQRSNEVGCAHN